MAIYIGDTTDPRLNRRTKRRADLATLQILGLDGQRNWGDRQTRGAQRRPYMAGDIVVGWQGEGGPFIGEKQSGKHRARAASRPPANPNPNPHPSLVPTADLQAIPTMPRLQPFQLDRQSAPMSRRQLEHQGGQAFPNAVQPNMSLRPDRPASPANQPNPAASPKPGLSPNPGLNPKPGWALDPGLLATSGAEAAAVAGVWQYDQVKKRQALRILTRGNAGNFKANLNMRGKAQLNLGSKAKIPRIESRRYAAKMLASGWISASQAKTVLNARAGNTKALLSATAGTTDLALKIAGRAAGVAGVGLSVYDELKALPKDAGWGRRGTAVAKGVLKEVDNLAVGGFSTIAAGILLANPIAAAGFGLALATAYGLGFDKRVNRAIDAGSRNFIRNFFGD